MSDLFLNSKYLHKMPTKGNIKIYSTEWFLQEMVEVTDLLQTDFYDSEDDLLFQSEITKRKILKIIENDKRTCLERALVDESKLEKTLNLMKNSEFNLLFIEDVNLLQKVKALYAAEYYQYLKDMFLYMRGVNIVEAINAKFGANYDWLYYKEGAISRFIKEFHSYYPRELFELANYSNRDYEYIYMQSLIIIENKKKGIQDV